MSRISVIIPVYNAATTLRKCVDSVLRQKNSNYELILVNDGSKDNSGAICDEYAAKDPHIRVIHKTNGGVSSARNVGIKEATGDWISFIDSDDYVGEDYLPEELDASRDLYLQHWMFEDDGYEMSKDDVPPQKVDENKVNDFFGEYLHHFIFKSPCAKFYKREIIVREGLGFDNSFRIGEDCLFNMRYYPFVKSLEVLEKGVYKYCRAEIEDDYKGKYHLSVEESISFLSKLWELYAPLHFRNNDFLDGERRFYKSMCMDENPFLLERLRWTANRTIYEINCELNKYSTPKGRIRQVLVLLVSYAYSLFSKIS